MIKIEELKEYINFLSKTDIEEIEITTQQGEKICLKRSEAESLVKNLNKDVKQQQDKSNEEKNSSVVKEIVITSPMVGKFLLSTSKDHPPFVMVSSSVKKGQKVAIIETMRIFRDVISPEDGVVKKILVEDGQYVEYGQPLIVLEKINN
ncbi:MAG: acetyl-CoA carboxylase biotin carboxyl carrier protein [Endomicrobiia bacterium]